MPDNHMVGDQVIDLVSNYVKSIIMSIRAMEPVALRPEQKTEKIISKLILPGIWPGTSSSCAHNVLGH